MSTAPAASDRQTLERTVAEAPHKDAGRGVVRLDPADAETLGLSLGDTVTVAGERAAVGKVLPMSPDARGEDRVQMDGVLRENAEAGLGDTVTIRPVDAPAAQRVVLHPVDTTPSDEDLDYIGRRVDGRPVQPGDRMRVTLFGSRWVDFTVAATEPDGAVLITPQTTLVVADPPADGDEGSTDETPSRGRLTYEDIGGLGQQLRRVREIIELPLRAPDVFERLGIDAPKGVLLAGPPGCGKTLLARTVAAETNATFFSISGPEIIRKLYGESEAQLRQVFEQAERQQPSIVFIDEIDAIAPRRESVEGDVEKRVVATLLTLMDGLEPRQGVIVIAATNRADALDPALRRAGRFDREINIPIPDRQGRREILEIHSRGMPLADTVALDRLAETTHGFVGADLEALCREAAMAALRRTLPDFGLGQASVPYDTLSGITVQPDDFAAARREVQASALREVFTEVPDVRWDDVGGLDDVRERLTEAVEWPLRHAALFDAVNVRPPKGILLAGPPGCGKTLLARALATEAEANFISVKGPELLSKYVGASEEKVREIFRKARAAAPCIVFFDEVDALAPTRTGGGGTDGGVANRVLAQLLTEIDGVEDLEDVVVIGATNRPDRLDPALLRPGRFDEIVRVDRPDAAARRAILSVHLRDKPTAETLDLDGLVAATDGFSGADLAACCQRAALDAMRPAIQAAGGDAVDDAAVAGEVAIRQEHLEQAVQTVRRRTDDLDGALDAA
jgi:transitional endoplasmic reticulum ATPase